MRERLRTIGLEEFVRENITNDKYSIRKIATAFGIRPYLPYGDAFYYQIVGQAMLRELARRQKLPQYNTIDDAVSLLQSKKNIMVITGAGISTSLGIPDFRSKNTGFYSQLLARGFESPEDVFDIENFDMDPRTFYELAGEILPVLDKTSPTHAFIRLLQDKGKLLTNYTQNIDNIEAAAGIDPAHLIQCHGSWATATCRKCKAQVPGATIFSDVKAKRVARCTACVQRLSAQQQQPKKRKRAPNSNSNSSSRSRGKHGHVYSDDDSDGQYDIPEPGVMKPDITFFGEQLPNTFFDRLTDHDREKVDLVVIVGTSMKVAPVSEIPNFIPKDVPCVYISREPVEHINFDVTLLGYCDDVVSELCRRAGWGLDHPMALKGKADVSRFDEGDGSRWKVTRPVESS